MPYSSRCSICTHEFADVINDLLVRRSRGEEGVTYEFIADKMAALGVPVTTCALSRHNSKHFNVREAAAVKANRALNDASDELASEMVADAVFLDKVVARANELLDRGELSPDLQTAIRAIDVKHSKVMKETNPMEALLGTIAEASGASGE